MRDETKQDISSRLKSIEGHVRGVCRMVDENAYCIDIIKQTNAIQSALERVNAIILDEHLKTCVTTAMRSDKQSERERVLAELVDVFQAGGKIKDTTGSWTRGGGTPPITAN